MTCIVGLEHADQVVLGFDSFGCASPTVAGERRDTKGWTHAAVDGQPAFVFGATSSYRMLQVVRYYAPPPKVPITPQGSWIAWDDDQWMRWMVTEYVPCVRKALKDQAVTEVENNVESCGQWLVGIEGGRLFTIGSDFQVGRSAQPYAACGAGAYHALGAMHALRAGITNANRPENLITALCAAADHGSAVRAPFHLISTG